MANKLFDAVMGELLTDRSQPSVPLVEGAPESRPTEARCAVSGGSLPVSSVDALFVRWNCKACNALDRAQRAYNTGDRLERTREEAAAAAFQLAAKELRAEMERVNMRQPEENTLAEPRP